MRNSDVPAYSTFKALATLKRDVRPGLTYIIDRKMFTIAEFNRPFLLPEGTKHVTLQATSARDVSRHLATVKDVKVRVTLSPDQIQAEDKEWLRIGLIRRPIF